MNKIASILGIVSVILLGTTLYFYSESSSKDFKLYQQSITPDIKLTNLQYEFENKAIPISEQFNISVVGFVVFDNIEDQPKNLRQYYVIETDYDYSDGVKRTFSVESFVKLPAIAPSSIGKEEMTIEREDSGTLVLEDESGNKFTINKISKEITIQDVNKDRTSLITNLSDYGDFMREFSN